MSTVSTIYTPGSIHYTVETVTPEMAQDYIDSTMFAGQRPLRPYHVNTLVTMMRNGHFRQGTIITFAMLDGNRHCVNGQHTLHAIVKYGKPYLLTIEEHEVTSEQEIASLYASFDRQLTRSYVDMFRAHEEVDRKTYHFNRPQLEALSGAMPLVISGFTLEARLANTIIAQSMKDGESRYRFVEAWAEEAKLAFDVYTNCPHALVRFLQRAAVFSVALITYRWQPEMAQKFWGAIANDDGLTRGMPEKTLLDFLRKTPAAKYNGLVYARYVASAWNAAFKKGQLQHLTLRDTENPIFIAGTPHDGTKIMQYLGPDMQPMHTPIALRAAA